MISFVGTTCDISADYRSAVRRPIENLEVCGDLYPQTLTLVSLIPVEIILCWAICGVCPMLPGVYMVKFDTLNLRSKITKKAQPEANP